MVKEIERKFLVSGDKWRLGTTGVLYRQGCLSTHIDRTVRVRLEGDKGYLTVKGRTVGALVLENGGNEDQAIAGLLHDAVEDQGGKPILEEIRVRFGDDVAKIVAYCTDAWEEPKPPWRARKEA